MRLLLVEDDPTLGPSLRQELGAAGFIVDLADDGRVAEYLGATETYALVVLDLGLPGLSGLEILGRWRAAGNRVPVLILTARNTWHERVDGFKAGADDYLGKPFHAIELVARVLAIIKRSVGQAPGVLVESGLTLDEERQMVRVVGEQEQQLSATEFRILRTFMLHPDKILSKADLMEQIYGAERDPDSNVVEVYIARLRGKIGKHRIRTRRNQGYVFGAAP
jgi:two-component system, OmpR family, response regulator